MGDRTEDDVTEDAIGLKSALLSHRSSLLTQLDSNTLFLTYLAKYRIIDPADILKYESYTDDKKRNGDVIDSIIRKQPEPEVTDVELFSKFLEALKKSGQENLAAMMTNIHRELDLVDKYQDQLGEHLKRINSFLDTESRRAAVRFKPDPIEEEGERGAVPGAREGERGAVLGGGGRAGEQDNLTDFLYKVHQTTKSTLVKFDRCKEVIEKLHKDCDNVAQKNAEMLDKLRECEEDVLAMLPAHLLTSRALVKYDAAGGETNRSRSSSRASSDDVIQGTPRLKMTEADRIIHAIRGHLGQIAEHVQQSEVDRESCNKIIERMMDDIRERRGVLSKAAEAPLAKPSGARYVEGLPPLKVTAVTTFRSQVRPKLELFADTFQEYIQHESQVTHKMNINKYQAGLAHRQFDQIDGDLVMLQREMRRNDKERAAALAKHIVDATKAEREDCLRMLEDVERSVRTRRQKIQDAATYDKTRGRRRRPQFSRVKFTKKVDSNFSKRLNDLTNEVQAYIDTESEQLSLTKAELSKKKVDFDSQIRVKQTEVKSLETKLREMTSDRDKFRMLYNKEKTMTKAKIITKPTIPKREVKPGGGGGHHSSLPPIRTNARRATPGAGNHGYRPRGTGSSVSSSSMTSAPRSEPLGGGSTSRTKTRPVGMVKPRLTQRARDLKGLKDNLKAKRKMAKVKPLTLIPEAGETDAAPNS